MSKLNLNPIRPGYQSTESLDENFQLIEGAIQDTLSRSGKTPNHMESDLDMNGKNVLNVDSFQAQEITLGGKSVDLSDLQTLTDIGSDIKTLAEIQDGTVYTEALTTLAPISQSIVDTANVNSDVAILGPIASDIVNVSSVYTYIPTVGDNIQAVIDAPQFAQDAETARDKARQWSEEEEGIEVEAGEFSAFHWAMRAKFFAEGDAVNILYNNTSSGITSENVQAAIDELVQIKARLDGGNNFFGDQSISGDLTVDGVFDCGAIA